VTPARTGGKAEAENEAADLGGKLPAIVVGKNIPATSPSAPCFAHCLDRGHAQLDGPCDALFPRSTEESATDRAASSQPSGDRLLGNDRPSATRSSSPSTGPRSRGRRAERAAVRSRGWTAGAGAWSGFASPEPERHRCSCGTVGMEFERQARRPLRQPVRGRPSTAIVVVSAWMCSPLVTSETRFVTSGTSHTGQASAIRSFAFAPYGRPTEKTLQSARRR